MKTLLYEIRYYLAATLLVIFLLPDKTEPPKKPDENVKVNQVSTIRNNLNRPVDTYDRQAKKTSQKAQPLHSEKKTKNNETDHKEKVGDLFPEPNRY
jgi:hypothetical protein